MKTPFRYQATERDCVPTTFINAISYLFERKNIPSYIIASIYRYTLDWIENEKHALGTSFEAVKFLTSHLDKLKSDNFPLIIESIEDDRVHFKKGSKIIFSLTKGGIAILDICDRDPNDSHVILAIKIDGNYLYCFDPYYRRFVHNLGENVIVLKSINQKPNLKIKRTWLDTYSEKKPFCLGTKHDRHCILMRRE